MVSFGFIGSGKMGGAMLMGARKIFKAEEFTFTARSQETKEKIEQLTQIKASDNNQELVKQSKFIFLLVKPQQLFSILEEIKEEIKEDHIFISVAAGVTIQEIKNILGKRTRIIRLMPNTPALVGEAMSGVSFSNEEYTQEEKNKLFALISSFGKYEIVPEEWMNAVICVSGSSPVYVYMLIQSLSDCAVKYGIPREKAIRMAAQTVLGAAKMVLDTKEHPEVLKDQVCSPGGTTIAAVSALEEEGFRGAVLKAGDRCYQKARDMEKRMG